MAIAYDPNFRLDLAVQPYRCGASLPAFARLARTKGYRLIGIESRAINAFFVREGLGHDLLPERTVRECYEQNLRLRRWEPTWLDAMRSGDQRWVDV